MKEAEIEAAIEDLLEGFNQPTYRGMRVNGVRVLSGAASEARADCRPLHLGRRLIVVVILHLKEPFCLQGMEQAVCNLVAAIHVIPEPRTIIISEFSKRRAEKRSAFRR
jgi:hypothetical protein